jgi:hypothetical protein
MSKNNSVGDSYNPPGIGTEFEPMPFEDVEVDDLLWIGTHSIDGLQNPVYKKINETSAQNLQTGALTSFSIRQEVYQKT